MKPGPATVLVCLLPLNPLAATAKSRICLQATQWTLVFIAALVIGARLYLRLLIQRRKLLNSDILMCAAWVAGIGSASFDIVLLRLGALEPDVATVLEQFHGTPEVIQLILKVSRSESKADVSYGGENR